ncbi:MAG: monovalent cation/H+ antiporter complex subunit F [Planctomycetota bacterium]
MNIFLISLGVGLLLIMFIPMFRVVFGPTTFDRIMGVNVIGTKTTVLLVIIGAIYERIDMFVDIALAYAMLNFIATIAASKYFRNVRRDAGSTTASAGGEGRGS